MPHFTGYCNTCCLKMPRGKLRSSCDRTPGGRYDLQAYDRGRPQAHPPLASGRRWAARACLGRAASSISRELSRNTGGRGYRPKQAHEQAQKRALRPGPRRFTDEVRALSSCGSKRVGLQSSSVDAPGWRDVQWCARSRSNGLIRRLHPKQSSFAEIGEEELKRIEMFLNDRPRICLGWMTPREKLAAFLATPRDERSIIENLPPRDTVLPLPLWGTPAGTGSTVSLGGTASRHSGFACLFTISTPFSHLAPT